MALCFSVYSGLFIVVIYDCNFHPAAFQAQSLGTAPLKAATNENVLHWKKEDVAKWLQDIGFAV